MMKSRYIKTKAFVFFFLISAFVVNAQESDEQFTQYTYNATTINPAFAGARGITSVFGSFRTQWVGVPGAPQTIMVSANGASRNKNMGLGISFLNDRIGPSDQNTISVDFAYSIKINTDYRLAFGAKVTGNLINVNFQKLNISPNDFSFENNIDNKFSPNVGFGFDLHSDRTSISISVPNLLKTKFYDKYSTNVESSKIATENLNVFVTADHVFELSPDLVMKPAILLKMGPNQLGGGYVQPYISDTFGFYERFNLGVSYRYRGTISALAGFQITDGIFIGYGYDLETMMMRTYSTASHEIFMRFDFATRNNKKKKT